MAIPGTGLPRASRTLTVGETASVASTTPVWPSPVAFAIEFGAGVTKMLNSTGLHGTPETDAVTEAWPGFAGSCQPPIAATPAASVTAVRLPDEGLPPRDTMLPPETAKPTCTPIAGAP